MIFRIRYPYRYVKITVVFAALLVIRWFIVSRQHFIFHNHDGGAGDYLRMPNSSILILYWTSVFGDRVNVTDKDHDWPFFSVGKNCSVRCELSTNKSRSNEASAVVIHGRDVEEIISDVPPKSVPWIYHVNESPRYTSSIRNKEVMAKFNLFATYRLDSDFPCPQFKRPELTKPIPFDQKNGTVVAIYSHCEGTRTLYMLRLMKHLKIDSYGKCLRNKPRLPGSYKNVRETIRRYKFTLVFPNSDCDYYMTEKIYTALSSGSVPVWMGTDKIDKVIQWGNLKHAIIKVKDFPSPRKLADYLLWLAGNKTEYNKYLKWKYEGFNFPPEYYKSAIGQWWEGLSLYCRVCIRLAEGLKGHHGLPVDNCDGKQRRTLEKWIRE